MGTTRDIGNMCLFLGSEMAAYVSGAVLPVDGALSERGAGWLGKQMGDMLRDMPDKREN